MRNYKFTLCGLKCWRMWIVKSIETRCSMQAKAGDVTVLGVFGGVEREEECKCKWKCEEERKGESRVWNGRLYFAGLIWNFVDLTVANARCSFTDRSNFAETKKFAKFAKYKRYTVMPYTDQSSGEFLAGSLRGNRFRSLSGYAAAEVSTFAVTVYVQ